MLPDEKKLKLINIYALAIIAFVSVSFNVWLVIERIEHGKQDITDQKEVIRYKDKLIEQAQEQKRLSAEMERISELLKK